MFFTFFTKKCYLKKNYIFNLRKGWTYNKKRREDQGCKEFTKKKKAIL